MGDAGQVQGARRAGPPRAEGRGQLLARGEGHHQPAGDHVVVEVLLPLLHLRRVDQRVARVDAGPAQVLDVGVDDALEGGRVVEQLDFERLSGGVAAHAVAQRPAGLVEELRGGPQGLAVGAVRARDRGHVGGPGEHLRRQQGAVAFEQRPLRPLRRPRGLQVGVLPEAVGAGVQPVEQRLVGPLEVEQQAERLAHPDVGELAPPHVDPEPLRARGPPVREALLDDPALAQRREVVFRGPDLREELLVEQVFPRLQRLEGGGVVGEVLVDVAVEVVGADAGGVLRSPVARHPAVFDGLARRHLRHLVGAGAQRRIEGRFGEVHRLVVVLGQDVHVPGDGRQVAGPRAFPEGELHPVGAERLDRFEVLVGDRVDRMPFLEQDVEGEHDVGGGDRMPVGEGRLRAHVEDHPLPVLRVLQRLGDVAVGGIRLVGGADQQAVVEQAQPLRGLALEDEGVQAVEGLRGPGPA